MMWLMVVLGMVICFCAGVLTEKHFADKEIEMLRTRKVRPVKRKEKCL